MLSRRSESSSTIEKVTGLAGMVFGDGQEKLNRGPVAACTFNLTFAADGTQTLGHTGQAKVPAGLAVGHGFGFDIETAPVIDNRHLNSSTLARQFRADLTRRRMFEGIRQRLFDW